MFTVYKITNLINQKCYIGSSIKVERRWKQHINCSKEPNNKNYNYPLYQAFRKYGLENFSFEVLKDDFETIKEMTDYEKEMIFFYNSYNNGYNQTLNTDRGEYPKECLEKISQKCAKVDIYNNILEVYSSYHEAATKNGKDGDVYATHIREVCKGIIGSFLNCYFRDLDEQGNIITREFKTSHGKKPIFGIKLDNPEEEIYFDSISEAAKQLKTDRCSLGKCIQGVPRYSNVKGYVFRELDLYGNIIEVENLTIEDVINNYEKRNPMINGERHDIPTWGSIYNIKPATINARIRKGMDVVEAITTPIRR